MPNIQQIMGTLRTVVLLDTDIFKTHLPNLEIEYKKMETLCEKAMKISCEDFLE